jgi:hypothetical protein
VPTFAAILSRSSPASIFSFIAVSYLRFSSIIVGSYLAKWAWPRTAWKLQERNVSP